MKAPKSVFIWVSQIRANLQEEALDHGPDLKDVHLTWHKPRLYIVFLGILSYCYHDETPFWLWF